MRWSHWLLKATCVGLTRCAVAYWCGRQIKSVPSSLPNESIRGLRKLLMLDKQLLSSGINRELDASTCNSLSVASTQPRLQWIEPSVSQCLCDLQHHLVQSDHMEKGQEIRPLKLYTAVAYCALQEYRQRAISQCVHEESSTRAQVKETRSKRKIAHGPGHT